MKSNQQKLCIIVPAFNEETVIGDTLQSLRRTLRQHGVSADIVVIDDGSSDRTSVQGMPYCDFLVIHRRNCGLGAALATGIEFAKRNGYGSCVTFDSDGQHDPSDITKAIKLLQSGKDVVIGSRFLGSHSRMPRGRRVVLWTSNLVTWIFFGVRTTDSQSGFRALSRRAIEGIELKSNRMEVSSEFFGEINRLGLTFAEFPIHIRYTDYSLQKGQANTNSLNVLIKLLYKIAR
jgi:glycosyltransferase involved in cell wall biosynthesis